MSNSWHLYILLLVIGLQIWLMIYNAVTNRRIKKIKTLLSKTLGIARETIELFPEHITTQIIMNAMASEQLKKSLRELREWQKQNEAF